jgi:hypothetical protein
MPEIKLGTLGAIVHRRSRTGEPVERAILAVSLSSGLAANEAVSRGRVCGLLSHTQQANDDVSGVCD